MVMVMLTADIYNKNLLLQYRDVHVKFIRVNKRKRTFHVTVMS